jgi:hypothetical protein
MTLRSGLHVDLDLIDGVPENLDKQPLARTGLELDLVLLDRIASGNAAGHLNVHTEIKFGFCGSKCPQNALSRRVE